MKSATQEWIVGDGAAGPVTMRLREQLLGIQTGVLTDKHKWLQRLA